MRDSALSTEFKEFRLHGRAGAWHDLTIHKGMQTDVAEQTSHC